MFFSFLFHFDFCKRSLSKKKNNKNNNNNNRMRTDMRSVPDLIVFNAHTGIGAVSVSYSVVHQHTHYNVATENEKPQRTKQGHFMV